MFMANYVDLAHGIMNKIIGEFYILIPPTYIKIKFCPKRLHAVLAMCPLVLFTFICIFILDLSKKKYVIHTK